MAINSLLVAIELKAVEWKQILDKNEHQSHQNKTGAGQSGSKCTGQNWCIRLVIDGIEGGAEAFFLGHIDHREDVLRLVHIDQHRELKVY